MLVDTHAHLQWGSFDKDREKVISRAREVAVEYIVNIGFDVDGSRETIELAEKHKGLLNYRWVMDHEADYLFMKAVYEALYEPGKVFLSGDILNLLEEQPQLVRINAGIPRDEGIRRAVEQENGLS